MFVNASARRISNVPGHRIAAAVALLNMPVGAATTRAAPSVTVRLTRYEFKYYRVETDLRAAQAKFIGTVMDATGKEYDRRFKGFRGSVRDKPLVRVFATKDQFLNAFARSCGEPNIHSAGIYCGRDGVVYAFQQAGLAQLLMHECFHQFVHRVISNPLPSWLNEGLAEYFGEGVFDRKSQRLGLGAVPAWRIELLNNARSQRALLPLDKLMRLTYREWSDNMADDRGPIQYSQSWLLCHFLIHGDGGKYQDMFDKFLHRIDDGLDWDTAFKRIFGTDTQALERSLATYLRTLKPAPAQRP